MQQEKAWMIAIINKSAGERIRSLMREQGILCQLVLMGMGTANSQILECLGLGKTEKELLLSFLPAGQARDALERLRVMCSLDKKGQGIAFTLPICALFQRDGAGGTMEAKGCLKEGNHQMEQTENELIISIANRGFSDLVMEAARKAGAAGGTILHARGSAADKAEKFFGITIQPEKELVLIVAARPISRSIMAAIDEAAGVHTEARAVSFTLPVSGIAGMNTGASGKE